MSKTALTYAETAAFIVAVGVPIHYFAGLDWPWAIVIGAAASIILRFLIHAEPFRSSRKRPPDKRSMLAKHPVVAFGAAGAPARRHGRFPSDP